MNTINGFSNLTMSDKIETLRNNIPLNDQQIGILTISGNIGNEINNVIKNLSENYISNYSLPFSVAPNFRINGKMYFVPMVTEESSVVAAASSAAKFWSGHGGFKAEVTGTKKRGQIYFSWDGPSDKLVAVMPELIERLKSSVKQLTASMEKRGGGITEIASANRLHNKNNYHIINVEFETIDSMGANLINSCLEIMGSELISYIKSNFTGSEAEAEIIMAILSNYNPECIVECFVECDINHLAEVSGNLTPEKFAGKFVRAVQIANEDISRAVTHNKGIFNGIDAVLIATGNDFRAVEACGHAYAASDGKYRSLSNAVTDGKKFRFTLRIPLSLGTVGGATSVHPMALIALQIMQNPSAKELMMIVSGAGLASNFAAIRSLITDGIQKGHMKLHLINILQQFKVTEKEKISAMEYFSNKQFSANAVSGYLDKLRAIK